MRPSGALSVSINIQAISIWPACQAFSGKAAGFRIESLRWLSPTTIQRKENGKPDDGSLAGVKCRLLRSPGAIGTTSFLSLPVPKTCAASSTRPMWQWGHAARRNRFRSLMV